MRFYAMMGLILLTVLSCSPYFKFDEMYDKGNYLQAYQYLDQLEDKNNYHYMERLFRVVIKIALDGDTDFIEKLKKLPKTNQMKEIENYVNFAKSYILFLEAANSRDYQKVISNLTDITNVPPEFLVHQYKIIGAAYYRVANYSNAISNFMMSYRLEPYIDNFYFIGMCYYYLEDYESATNHFYKLVNNSQNEFLKGLVYYQLGEMYYYQSNYESALAEYLNAINNNSQNADCSYKIAKCLQKLKYTGLGQKFLKISLRTQRDNANAWYYLNVN